MPSEWQKGLALLGAAAAVAYLGLRPGGSPGQPPPPVEAPTATPAPSPTPAPTQPPVSTPLPPPGSVMGARYRVGDTVMTENRAIIQIIAGPYWDPAGRNKRNEPTGDWVYQYEASTDFPRGIAFERYIIGKVREFI